MKGRLPVIFFDYVILLWSRSSIIIGGVADVKRLPVIFSITSFFYGVCGGGAVCKPWLVVKCTGD